MEQRKTYWFIAYQVGNVFGNAFIEWQGTFLNIREVEKELHKDDGLAECKKYIILNYKQVSSMEFYFNVKRNG